MGTEHSNYEERFNQVSGTPTKSIITPQGVTQSVQRGLFVLLKIRWLIDTRPFLRTNSPQCPVERPENMHTITGLNVKKSTTPKRRALQNPFKDFFLEYKLCRY